MANCQTYIYICMSPARSDAEISSNLLRRKVGMCEMVWGQGSCVQFSPLWNQQTSRNLTLSFIFKGWTIHVFVLVMCSHTLGETKYIERPQRTIAFFKYKKTFVIKTRSLTFHKLQYVFPICPDNTIGRNSSSGVQRTQLLLPCRADLWGRCSFQEISVDTSYRPIEINGEAQRHFPSSRWKAITWKCWSSTRFLEKISWSSPWSPALGETNGFVKMYPLPYPWRWRDYL